jgi:hypothetical protein
VIDEAELELDRMRHQPPPHVDPAAGYDSLWRKVPHVLGFMHYARAIPGFARHFSTRVPDEFTAQVALGVLEVACPCGETPQLTGAPALCDCGRVFAEIAGTVRVGYIRTIDGGPVVD